MDSNGPFHFASLFVLGKLQYEVSVKSLTSYHSSSFQIVCLTGKRFNFLILMIRFWLTDQLTTWCQNLFPVWASPSPHSHRTRGVPIMLVPHYLNSPISGKGYTPYLGYWLPLANTKNTPFSGFPGKSFRDYCQKFPPFPIKWEYACGGPSCFRVGGGGGGIRAKLSPSTHSAFFSRWQTQHLSLQIRIGWLVMREFVISFFNRIILKEMETTFLTLHVLKPRAWWYDLPKGHVTQTCKLRSNPSHKNQMLDFECAILIGW